MPDAMIIGAGPAGSLCGLLLARRGWTVTLVEQHGFPRDKVCGECLSALGLAVLERQGLLQSLIDREAVWLRHALIHARDGRLLSISLWRPMLGVSRRMLDSYLLAAARAAGINLDRPARCEAVEAVGGVMARVRDLRTNQMRTLRAAYAVIADGKSALPEAAPPASGELGIKCHWEGIRQPPDAIQLFGFDGGYGGFSRVENGRWNAAFAVSARHVAAHRGKLDALFAQMLEQQPALREKLAGARQVSDWIAAPLPRFAVRKNWPANIIPVGNAAAAIDPIGGEGMGLALRSAELAAAAMDGCRERPLEPHRLRKAYRKLWRRPRALCRAGAVVTRSAKIGPAAFEWLSANDRLTSDLLAAMGK